MLRDVMGAVTLFQGRENLIQGMNYTYLLVNVGSFIVPFLFSFHPKLNFFGRWRYAWPAIILTMVPFLIWDFSFTAFGIWGFTPAYLTGIYAGILPFEEVLFFICIPYSCLFTYHCFSVLIQRNFLAKDVRYITWTLLVLCASLGSAFWNHLYTSFTFLGLALMLAVVNFIIKAQWLSRFYFTYLILLIPFCIVNGILTGTGLDAPVVWYNNAENMAIRIGTIPFEDVFYGMFLFLVNVSIYEYLTKVRKKDNGSNTTTY